MHCVEAIREWIICHPDDTLLAKVDGLLPGEGQLRKCKNFGAYKEWAEMYAYVFPV
jgi:mycotoxin biosynthesis protein UstYa